MFQLIPNQQANNLSYKAPENPKLLKQAVTNRDTATGHVTGPYVYKPFPFSLPFLEHWNLAWLLK